MAQKFRALATDVAEDPSLFASIHVAAHTFITSLSRGPDTVSDLFWFLAAQTYTQAHTLKHTCTHN